VSASQGLADTLGVSFPSAEAIACPYPLYKTLRAEAPIYKLPGREEYVVTRHEDVFHATRHPEIFSSRHSVFENGRMRAATLADVGPDQPASIVMSDPPQHTPKRKLAFEMFKPGKLRGYEEMIRRHVDDLIDVFVDRGEVEFVAEFADPLPVLVIMTLFGLPVEDVRRAIAWGRYEGAGTRFAPEQRQQEAQTSILSLGAYLRDALVDRHDNPRDDELTRFVQAHVEHDGELDLANVVPDATNLMVGGIFTTTHLLANMMLLLLRNPEQLRAVQADTSLLVRTVEESLRCDAPVQWSPRLVLADTELGGTPIPAGAIVLLSWASANHDEHNFEDDETFDVARPNVKDHMAFGNGTHFCLGAPLARLEGRIGFEQIFARLPGLRLSAKNDFARLDSPLFSGPKAVWLEFDPTR
jgi:cytochrome P450